MTPADYTQFREILGPSSGFQSHRYRLTEYTLGNRNANMLKPHAHLPEIDRVLRDELARPSFYDEVVAHMYRVLDGPDATPPESDLSRPHRADPEI